MHPLTDHELSYYSTIAQVVPVLLLAFALEVRLTGWMQPGPSKATRIVRVLIAYALLILMFVAELVAVGTLRSNEASGDAETWTTLGLLAGFIPLFLGATSLFARDLTETLVEGREREDESKPDD